MQMRDVTPAFLDACAMEYVGYGKPLNLSPTTLEEAWDIERNVNNQATYGGTAPARVREQIAASRKLLEQDRRFVETKREKLVAADNARERAIDALLGSS